MDVKKLQEVVQRVVLCEVAKTGDRLVPVMSSNHHCHLSQADVERLFGPGYQLTKMRDLVQPGQFAANEKVTLETEKGKMVLRVVGPARKETQIELSFTDSVKLGLKPPVRMSGELAGSPGCVLSNGDKRITLDRGVIVAARHLHLAPDEALAYGLKDHDVVSLKVEGERGAILNNVIVRSGTAHLMEAHIDKDEANACGLTDGQLCRVIMPGDASPAPCAPAAGMKPVAAAPGPALQTYTPTVTPDKPALQTYAPAPKPEIPETMLDLTAERKCLIGESTVMNAVHDGKKLILYAKDAVVTPLARDAANRSGVELALKPATKG